MPIFAEHYFKITPDEMGIDFISVGGHGNYLPFIRVSESLKIPWFIFSDGEPETKKSVQKSLKSIYGSEIDIEKEPNIVILDRGYDFERYIL